VKVVVVVVAEDHVGAEKLSAILSYLKRSSFQRCKYAVAFS
jgi:ribose 5-phosphate isomerase RpiB